MNIDQVITQRHSSFLEEKPKWLLSSALSFLKYIYKVTELHEFLATNEHLTGLPFVENVLEHVDLAYSVSNKQKENIPNQGRILIVANHPLGILDAFALVQLISEARSDIRMVVADYFSELAPLKSLFLPLDTIRQTSSISDTKPILDALDANEAVIIFPATGVSRARPGGIRDTKWNSGFIDLAQNTQTSILPVYIGGRNSQLFYTLSAIWKPLASVLLVREMFKQSSRTIHIRVGERISAETLSNTALSPKVKAGLVKRHLYRLGKKRKGIFQTEQSIAHPESPKTLKAELRGAERLGKTTDGKHIYLVNPENSSILMREIGRLRELSFRQVGEGTGQRRDLDPYDQYYEQIILWDENDLEVAGAYRIGEGRKILEARSLSGFYIHSLFELSPEFARYAEQGIELGRSFVQPKYWGSRALDYLWQGIGAYLAKNREIRWMFGPVSISNSYHKGAKDLLVYFYSRFFRTTEEKARCRQPYLLNDSVVERLDEIFCHPDYSSNFRTLKDQLAHYDLSVPTLFKQYTELYEEGGVSFFGFNVDPNFNQCVDGLILADLSRLKPSKFERYIGRNLLAT